MIRRAWRAFTGACRAEARGWRTAKALIASIEAPAPGNPQAPAPNPGEGVADSPDAAHGRAAPSATPAPSPGHALPPAPPSPPGHPDRRLRKRIDVLRCGCTYIYDARDREWNVITCCGQGIDWDQELRRLNDAT